jgi:hypothetical protein
MVRKLGIAVAVVTMLVLTLSVASAATVVFNAAAAPSGTHVQTGTPDCTVSGNTVTCSSYELAGVGNTNAQATLTATYSATVDCTNKGGKLVPVKSTVQTAPSSTGELEAKNGRLAVPSLVGPGAPSAQSFLDAATCPNGNWTKSLASGSPTLESWMYTLTFVGYNAPYITITP